MECILGVDTGTTNVKALALNLETGQLVAHASRPLTTLHPRPGYCEQAPDEIWTALNEVLHEACQEVQQQGGTVSQVCFSTAMHSILAVDAQGRPLTNALIWSDNRAERQATTLLSGSEALGRDIYNHTGTPIHPMTPLCKLAWFRDHQPRLLHRSSGWISIKEFIWHKLTGKFQIDYSMATATGLFDSQRLSWYQPALQFAGVSPEQLSEPVPTTTLAHYEKGAHSEPTALPDGVALYIGASDGCLANLGAGAVEAGITTITIGTSGAIRRTTGKPLRDSQKRLFSYILDVGDTRSYYIVGGPTNNGANVLQWVSEKLTRQETEVVLEEAAGIAPGSDGLLFLPYLLGERAPLWNANARGAYTGIDWQHGRAHFVRAALEGVLFNLLSIEHILTRHTGPTKVIHANGGFAQSDLWVQMMADIFGVPVRLNESNESGAIGAILLAMKASGKVATLPEATRQVGFGRTFEPNAEHHRLYRQIYRRFEKAVAFVTA